MASGHLQQLLLAGQLEAQQGVAVLETLGPLGPAARGVAAGNGDDGGAIARFPAALEVEGFLRCQLQSLLNRRQ